MRSVRIWGTENCVRARGFGSFTKIRRGGVLFGGCSFVYEKREKIFLIINVFSSVKSS